MMILMEPTMDCVICMESFRSFKLKRNGCCENSRICNLCFSKLNQSESPLICPGCRTPWTTCETPSSSHEMIWYKDGKIHRDDDLPARITTNGDLEWWYEGKSHRTDDRAAYICSNGHSEWWFNDQLHRELDKPAIITETGEKQWWKYGKQHREDGKPAIIKSDGTKEWWIDGIIQEPIILEVPHQVSGM